MDRAAVWRDFDEARILFEDLDLVAIDKPAFVSSQAADPERPDDVVTRLRRHFAERGRPSYLGVHQRLDRDTSGVLVMTRRREANAQVAAQFEGRKVLKVYRACVVGWPKGRGRAVLDDVLVPGDGGGMRVGSRQDLGPRGRGQRAITRVRVVEQREDRTMLELELETGRTHQARVQLARAGAPIAGDALYGVGGLGGRVVPAPRLMLHAYELELVHPSTGAPIRFTAPLPPELRAWLDRGDIGPLVYDDPAALDGAIGRAFERRFGLGRADQGPRATTAFRVINESGDGLPKLAVDVYGEHLVAQLYEDGDLWTPGRQERLLDALARVGTDGIYLKRRPKQANVLVDTRREDLAPCAPVRGTAAEDEIGILEEGIPYGARLGDGLATGIYLDQRANRRRLREMAAGKRVANLFAYTCAFSVAAAKGGAVTTTSVDASAVALGRGQANFTRAGVPLAGHAFVADDVFAWLARAKARSERYDIMVLDPPSFSTTKQTTFTAVGGYVDLAAQALLLLAPGGVLLACANHRKMVRAKFRRYLHEAAHAAGRKVAQLKDLADPADFPAAVGSESHLKSALLTLAS
jgi:23S rRNA (cytosine1962-C5)-methyltransferase